MFVFGDLLRLHLSHGSAVFDPVARYAATMGSSRCTPQRKGQGARWHRAALLVAVGAGSCVAQTPAQPSAAKPASRDVAVRSFSQTFAGIPSYLLQGSRFEGSPSIPLDSWIYAALDRLAALGYAPESTAMMRPYTRLEGARLVAEARSHLLDMDDDAADLLIALGREFKGEGPLLAGSAQAYAQVEEAYTRFTGIGGTPLRDGYHFAQTLVNDFGRPYGGGVNGISGLSMRGQAGPLAFYLRGEYQRAAPLPTSIYNPLAQHALIADDSQPFGWNLRFGKSSRVRPIEAYVSVSAHDWQLSVGQQTLWWGPDRSTSLILSNNASSLPMVRVSRVAPGVLPGPFWRLGPVHFDLFLARQGGVHFVRLGPNFTPYGTEGAALTPPPYLWGVHITVKPTPDFELGVAHTVIFAGYGRPLTFDTFLHSFSILGNGQAVDPGKRVTEINLNYHIPGYRRAIQVYSEGMAWDDPIEGKFVARFAWDPGVYLSELPKLPKVDARFEAVYTDLPKGYYTGYFYANAHYSQGYTNYGQILGSWVGRQGIGGQASSTYWFSPQRKVGVFYRKMVSDAALLGGGSNTDYGSSLLWQVRRGIEVEAQIQLERWKFPLLGQQVHSNLSGNLEIRFYPTLPIHAWPQSSTR